jgi:hypothetical protein
MRVSLTRIQAPDKDLLRRTKTARSTLSNLTAPQFLCPTSASRRSLSLTILGGMNSKPTDRRSLKVELSGDAFHKKTFPKIRLQGKWLQKLGFLPSGRVEIIPIAHGEIRLRFMEQPEPTVPLHLNEASRNYCYNPS